MEVRLCELFLHVAANVLSALCGCWAKKGGEWLGNNWERSGSSESHVSPPNVASCLHFKKKCCSEPINSSLQLCVHPSPHRKVTKRNCTPGINDCVARELVRARGDWEEHRGWPSQHLLRDRWCVVLSNFCVHTFCPTYIATSIVVQGRIQWCYSPSLTAVFHGSVPLLCIFTQEGNLRV